MGVRSIQNYPILPSNYFMRCLSICNAKRCIYPFVRFGRPINSINIDITLLYPLLIQFSYELQCNIINTEMLKTLKALPVWRGVQQLNVIGEEENEVKSCHVPLIDFLTDACISFTSIKKLQLPGYCEISSYDFMHKFSRIKGFCGHVYKQNDVVVGIPTKLISIHGSIESMDSLLNAFKIHAQIKEMSLFYDGLRMCYEGVPNHVKQLTNYGILINLERLRIDSDVCYTDEYKPNDGDMGLLMQQFSKIHTLKWIDFYVNGWKKNYLRLLSRITARQRTELILRYNYPKGYILNGIQLKSDLIVMIQSMMKAVTNWMIIIRWIEDDDFHKKLVEISNDINLAYKFNEIEKEYYLTKQNDMKDNIKKYCNTKWIMNCS